MLWILTSGLGMGGGGAAVSFTGASILAAAQAWWAGTPAAGALTASGKLWYKTAPEGGNVLPYATYVRVSEVEDTWTTNYPLMRTSLQFNCHAIRPQDAEAMGEALRALFRGAPLVVGTAAVAHVLPDGDSLDEGEGLAPGGRDCWIQSEVFDIVWSTI